MLPRFLRRSQASAKHTVSPQIRALMSAVEGVNRVELPDFEARAALYDAIRSGQIIGLYTPIGYEWHTVELAHMPRDLDPRITLEQWAEWWRAGKDAAAEHIAKQRAMQAAAWQAAQAEGGAL